VKKLRETIDHLTFQYSFEIYDGEFGGYRQTNSVVEEYLIMRIFDEAILKITKEELE